MAVTDPERTSQVADEGSSLCGGLLSRPDLTRIYREEFSFIYQYMRRLGVSEKDLEDAVHDVFVVCCRRFDDYDAQRPIRPWLCAIATRVASERRRSVHRKREVLQAEVFDVDAGKNPETALSDKDARDLVLRALDCLNEDQRKVFVLHDITDFSMPEIVEILNSPINTLYSRLRLARKQFAESVRRICGSGGDR
jgi:RNA polymerase sigma-70 factor (ECF subfamily)